MRTQAEIVARMTEKNEDDIFGFSKDVLLDSLDYEHAKPFLKEGVTAEQWNVKRECGGYGRTLQFPLVVEEDLKAAAIDYLKFAWGKAEDHRGLSAGRSVEKMTAFCWLLGHDTKAIEDAEYAMYGCPKLKVIAGMLDQPLPDDPALVLMMEGSPCSSGCEGCSS
jgi:hypothetical protein